MSDNRYARQIPFLSEESQRKIETTQVGIVGVGGLGSHVAQSLAFLGTGSFVLIDDDRVEDTNLNRLIGATPEDVAESVLKVKLAERNIYRINPSAQVRVISENLRSRHALEALTTCPVIFGCVDNDGARLILMELAAAYNATLIDSATEIVFQSGKLVEYGGRVIVARPGDYCLDCAGEINMQVAKAELESPETQAARRAHGYGLGDQGPALSVVSLNGIVANLAVTEYMVMIAGLRDPNRYLHYRGSRGVVLQRTVERRVDCFTCGYLAGTAERANIFRYALPEDQT